MLSNFYRDIIYVSIYKTAISLSHSLSLSATIRSSRNGATNFAINRYRIIENDEIRHGKIFLTVLWHLRVESWNVISRMTRSHGFEIRIYPSPFYARERAEKYDHRHSSPPLLTIARSFRKWDIRSRKFTDHEDTVLIESSKTIVRSEVHACVCVCVYTWIWETGNACMSEWMRRRMGAVVDVDRATHAFNHCLRKLRAQLLHIIIGNWFLGTKYFYTHT